MLTDAELDALRDTQADALPQTVTVQRRSLANDGAGGVTETWTGGSSLACRIAAPDARTLELAARLGEVVDAVITFAAQANVQAGDRVYTSGSATIFSVNGVTGGHSWETARRTRARKV